ncbi:restriction endonuclease [Haloferax sp. Atlit-4N]|uniref:5-methylcytosine restriction system specificity protein McrC n=1 Tax=Haloferax sp. Atlit-4N TaxID=2077206 RepID=UPI000E24BA40|nr:restriction endonuclease [Haloferax sp. Atlit-4N]RDZ50443.1 restriction endonuclease [Haloferax sp. Atlit-4N]
MCNRTATPLGIDQPDDDSVAARYRYESEPTIYPVPERGRIEIRDCPATITDLLDRGSITNVATGLYKKTQLAEEVVDGEQKEYDVVTASLRDDGRTLQIDAEDLVGVVSLAPTISLRINPKVEWDAILDMLLAVYQERRSVEYHGVPLEQFVGEGESLEDVVIILVINLLDGISKIHRQGLIRDLNIVRTEQMDGSGRIDLKETLLNHAQGNPSPVWIQNEVEYNNVANSLIHYAASHLRRLLQDTISNGASQQHEYLYSELDREIRRLEAYEISSCRSRTSQYRQLSIHDLPRQRYYYRQAIEISKAVLSASLSHQFSTETSALSVDYVMSMESLFEAYSQVTLEGELAAIKSYDHTNAVTEVEMRDSPTVNPFDDEQDIFHQPDHELVRESDTTLAVIDSKYYAEGKDPVRKSGSRSQLFSYAYLLDTDELGFLCPLLEPRERTVVQTDARLSVVSPQGEFSPADYRAAVHEYLFSVLQQYEPVLEIFHTLADPFDDRSYSDGFPSLCLTDVTVADLSEVRSMSGPFAYQDIERFTWRVIRQAGRNSYNVGNDAEFEDEGDWARKRITEELTGPGRSAHSMTCVPVMHREGTREWLELFIVNVGLDGSVTRETVELRPAT